MLFNNYLIEELLTGCFNVSKTHKSLVQLTARNVQAMYSIDESKYEIARIFFLP
jgi:hypothetical protein